MRLFFANPAMTAVLAWIVHREPLGALSLVGVFASLAGVTLVTRPPFLFGHSTWDSARFWGNNFSPLLQRMLKSAMLIKQ
jgi:drug/metabolite transporter (DMT)-like permease